MSSSNIDNDIPQWKKDLIARLRSQNKRTATAAERQQQQQQQLCSQRPSAQLVRSVQQPNLSEAVASRETCNNASPKAKMVQERAWDWDGEPRQNGSCESSEEDLHYGPGIVNKLKERYLSLAQRENTKVRPSILRKAASLENILDDAPNNAPETNRLFQTRLNGSNDTKNAPNRYRNKLGSELKRARSVEAISSTADREIEETRAKRESLHEEMLITEGSDKPKFIPDKMVENTENKSYSQRINRPKRIQPVMNEKEKPPVDVVKQAKMIFERRPEQRTRPPQQTGEVAAKVATYKSIIVQTKAAKKPLIKVKPTLSDKPKTNGLRSKSKEVETTRPKSIEKASSLELARPRSIEKSLSVELPRPRSIEKAPSVELPRPRSIEKTPSVEPPRPRSIEKISSVEPPRPRSIEKTPSVEPSRPRSFEKTPSVELPSPKLTEKLPSLEVSTEKSPSFDIPPSKSPESLPSPIPDISRVDFKTSDEPGSKSTSLTETPDLIITSSPLQAVNSPSFRISATENFIKEEIRLSLNERSPTKQPDSKEPNSQNGTTNSMTFNFAKSNKSQNQQLPPNKNVLNTQTPPTQPLKLEINGIGNVEGKKSPQKLSQDNEIKSPTKASQILGISKPSLTILEIEKNLINAAKTLEQPKGSVTIKCVEEVTKIKVPKVKKPPRELENTSIVFKFTDRKDVPDYVHNDGIKRVTKLEKPKVGEGGIILLPGASVGESFTDDDDEILRSLEGPPSPCDVTFINDNILIDGKSSLSQKTKKAKLKISFVDEGPEIYEYPSESSLLVEDVSIAPPAAQIRNSVPSLSGSSLANYTPKSTEDFQPGVTRSVQNLPTKTESPESSELILQEIEKPILFSAGANSDILF
jgi:hypothetical protein